MDSGKWMLTRLLILMIAWTASQVNGDGETIEMSVWVGDDVDLECADNSSDTTRRLWKRGDEIFLSVNEVIINNNRISLANRSAILKISNVTLDDQGYYTCTAYTQPKHTRTVHLQVKEKSCETPQKPLNGGYESQTEDSYKIGETIVYHCNRGYRLIGESNRTCTGTHKGWQPNEPYCEPEYIGRLLRRLDHIEDKMAVIEERLSKVENNTSKLHDQISALLEPPNRELDRNRKRLDACTNRTNVTVTPDTVSKCLTMQLGHRNGQSVSEFKWTVEDFESKRPNTSYVYYYSHPFYHTVPGYTFRLRVKVWPDYDTMIGLMFVPCASDEQLSWPFSTRYDLTVLMNDGTEFLYEYFSGRNPHCAFDRPPYEAEFDCYSDNYPDNNWKNVWENRQHVLKDGSVVVTVYLYN